MTHHSTTIAFTTLGCRVNQYDTQAMKEQLERTNLVPIPFGEIADIYVINTCTVTAAADSEGRMLIRRAKAQNPDSFVVVTGCLAQDRPEEVASQVGVNLVIGNDGKPAFLRKILEAYPKPELITPHPEYFNGFGSIPWGLGITRFDEHQRAIVKVQEGCNFGCSFCLVPRVRGKVISRPKDEILAEGKRLSDCGTKELVLTGIQLSSYGRDWGYKTSEPRLAPVIKGLLGIKGIQRIRLSSYGVADFEDALLDLWKEDKGFCPHLHLPLQSGDPALLKVMRRPYTLENFRRTVEKVRAVAPSLGLTTDVIAGFPGETEENFQNTLNFISELKFSDFHPFPYSDRPGTIGDKLEPKVSDSLIHDRMKRLKALRKECLINLASQALRKTFRVIVEKHDDQSYSGLTNNGLRVYFPREGNQLGKDITVKVMGAKDGQVKAEVTQ